MYGGYGYYYGFDPTMILVLIGVILSAAASSRVTGTFNQFSRVRSLSGLTGAEAARKILNSQGIYDVTIEQVAGNLTDHYDPRNKTLRLSQSVYGSSSIAAVGVAAHECGHAIQHNREYLPLKLRGAFVPIANLGAKISWPLILLGLILGRGGQMWIQIGIFMFLLAVLFQIITLPVEFNASGRALRLLDETGILSSQEVGSARKVLGAAALTYVAAAASSILQLLRLVLLFGGRRRDE